MKIYEIFDEEMDRSVGVLLYYEKQRVCIIELQEDLNEWTAPLLFTSYVKRKIYTIPRDISFLWVKERVIPSGRQNIGDILAHHHMQSYDEIRFLEISEGRCSQDSLCIRKIDRLPEYVSRRRETNVVDCVLLEDCRLLCFFANEEVKKIDLDRLKNSGDVDKIINNERLYRSGQVGVDGYYVTFNDSIDLPAQTLYAMGEKIPLKTADFLAFIRENVVDTAQSCKMLGCSRQNLSYMVGQRQLKPIRENVRGNLYLKGDILQNK